MKPVKLVLKFAILALSLVALHTMQTTSAQAAPLCRPFAVLCSTGTEAGHCGFRPDEDCSTCYGNDGSTLSGGCPRFE
jgi:hypothetical protein